MASQARPLLLFLGFSLLQIAAVAESSKASVVIPLEPEGAPKELFVGKPGITCLHGYRGATGLFWLSPDRVAVVFTTEKPCGKDAKAESNTVRLIIFDLSGKKIAAQDWKTNVEHLDILRGPGNTIVVGLGSKVQFLDAQLHEVESGQFDVAPAGLFATPFGRTLPVLTDKGKSIEFYRIQPLKRVSTLTLGSQPGESGFNIEAAGDERAAAVACTGRTALSCNRIKVITPEANFSLKNGQPWSYDEADKKADLNPVGFISDQELLVHRESLMSESVLIVRADGTATPLPQIKGLPRPTSLMGVANDGKRIALQAGGDPSVSNFNAQKFVVADVDQPKALFEKIGSMMGSAGGMSPDGKWFAIMDKAELSLYQLP